MSSLTKTDFLDVEKIEINPFALRDDRITMPRDRKEKILLGVWDIVDQNV